MSDSSGARLSDEGYLTGFPLAESGVFALSRTWPAPELPRPGCVWTHSLFVDFADLAEVDDLSFFDKLFQRPKGSDLSSYGRPVELSAPRTRHTSGSRVEKAWTIHLLKQLYGRPLDSIVLAAPMHGEADAAIFKVWSQQWPRLRRSFRFCTSVSADRSSELVDFDLQIYSRFDRSLRSRTVDPAEPAIVSEEPGWVDLAFDDLVDAGRGGLRSFLRSMGAEVSGTRRDFVPMVQLFGSLQDTVGAHGVSSAIRMLATSYPSPRARTGRVLIAQRALSMVEELSQEEVQFVLDSLELLDAELVQKYVPALAAKIAEGRIALVPSLLSASGVQGEIGREAVRSASLDQLEQLIQGNPEHALQMAEYRPELLASETFWLEPGLPVDELLDLGARSPNRAAIADALISTRLERLAGPVVRAFGSGEVLAAFLRGAKSHGRPDIPPSWISALAIDPVALASVLALGCIRETATIAALARRSTPGSLPNVGSVDPWLVATRQSDAEIMNDDLMFLVAFIFCRVIVGASSQPIESLDFSLSLIYFLASYRHLPRDAFQLLDAYLPTKANGGRYLENRVAAAAAEALLDLNLDVGVLAGVADNEGLFHDALREMSSHARGREYLRRLEARLRISDSRRNASRIKELKRLTR